MDAPGDLSGLAAALRRGSLATQAIAAVLVKTEGNGLGNDFTRPYVTACLRELWAEHGASPDTLPFTLVSGGSEGVISPHCLVLSRTASQGGEGLVVATAAGPIEAGCAGRRAQVEATERMVRDAMDRAGIVEPSQVGLVLVRAVGDAAGAAHDVRVRAAAALGVGLALGEVRPEAIDDAAIGVRTDLVCSRAFAVARTDTRMQQVVVVGNAPGGNPALRIAGGALDDPLDSPGVARLLARLGIEAAPQASAVDRARVVAAIVKGDPPPDGRLRGARHVMDVDADVAGHRHGRAAWGAMVASVIGHPYCFVGAGAEHCGPPGGGLAALIVRSALQEAA